MKFILFAMTCLIAAARGDETVQINPGQALGGVALGASSADLRKQGFVLDKSLGAPFLKRKNLLVRLVNDRAVQIWFTAKDVSKLRFDGKNLPRKHDAESFKKFFADCKESHGSGGKLLYCEHRGIELAFSFDHRPVGISVILPAEVDKVLGQAQ